MIQEAGFILMFRKHSLEMTGHKKGNVDTDVVFTIMSKVILRVSVKKFASDTALIARIAATALRSMQGICTRPAIGSQVKPKWCSIATSAAYSICFKPISNSSARAAAAIQQAEPISA